MSRFWRAPSVLTGTTQGSGSTFCSPPILLQPLTKVLPNGTKVVVPGSGAYTDLSDLTMEVVVNGQAGTSPTLTSAIHGTSTFMDRNTTLTSGIASTDTTIPLAERSGIPQFDYVLLMKADGTGYEWVQVTSTNTTGAGNHTITRAIFGGSSIAFSSGDYLFFTRSWTVIPTNNSSTTTFTTGAVSISAATGVAPVVTTLNGQALGMIRMPFPILRVATLVGGSNTPTATYSIHLSGLISETGVVRAR